MTKINEVITGANFSHIVQGSMITTKNILNLTNEVFKPNATDDDVASRSDEETDYSGASSLEG